ncbi:MAG: HEAT repeat domain-containing protein [Bacillota bacterium]|nr:HEAT repeat domain-containing protein [Bacillota bacterium]
MSAARGASRRDFLALRTLKLPALPGRTSRGGRAPALVPDRELPGAGDLVAPARGFLLSQARGPDPQEHRRRTERPLRLPDPGGARALEHPEEWTARRAAWLLGRVGTRESVPHLVRALERARDPYVQAEAAAALARIGDPAAVPALTGLLAGGPLPARVAAAGALAAFPVEAARRALERALDDPNQLVREEARRALGGTAERGGGDRPPES